MTPSSEKLLQRFFVKPDRDSPVKILSLSGLPAVGKTTAAKEIMRQDLIPGALLTEFKDGIPESIMSVWMNSTVNEKLRAQRWVLGQYATKNDLLGTIEEGRVIADRNLLDLLIYADAYGEDVFTPIAEEASIYDWVPALYVVLLAEVEPILKRLEKKEFLSSKNRAQWQELVTALKRSTEKLAGTFNLPVINTTDMMPIEVAQKVRSIFVGHFRTSIPRLSFGSAAEHHLT